MSGRHSARPDVRSELDRHGTLDLLASVCRRSVQRLGAVEVPLVGVSGLRVGHCSANC